MSQKTISFLTAVQLLLCLFVFTFFSCSSLKEVEGKNVPSGENILQLVVNENHFAVFNRQIQDLGLVAVDFRPATPNVSGGDRNEFWLTFRFANEEILMRNYVNLMSKGFVRRISYSIK